MTSAVTALPKAAVEEAWARRERVPWKTGIPDVFPTRWKGTICDPIGFSQHSGQCWNDSFQQIILFSDGLKEITQPLLYNTELDELYDRFGLNKTAEELYEELRANGSANSNYSWHAEIDTVLELNNRVKEYLENLQLRFINHYNFLHGFASEHTVETCMLTPDFRRTLRRDPKYQLKRQASYKFGIGAAKAITGESKMTTVGIQNFLIEFVAYLAPEYKSIQLTLDNNKPYNSYLVEIFKAGSQDGLIIKGLEYPVFQAQTPSSAGHVVGFFQCGGKFYFYDDNNGIFNCDLPREEIINLTYIAFLKGVPYFLKGPLLGPIRDVYYTLKNLTYWNDGWKPFHTIATIGSNLYLMKINKVNVLTTMLANLGGGKRRMTRHKQRRKHRKTRGRRQIK